MQEKPNLVSLGDFPPEILLNVFSFLRLEDYPAVGLVHSGFNRLTHDNLLWKKKFKRHFPHIYKEFKTKEEVDWRAEFEQKFKDQYKNIPATVRALFSLVKEGDLAGLKSSKIGLTALRYKDKKGYTLLKWARINNNQQILDFFFSEIIKNYSRRGRVRPNFKDKDGRNLLHWAVLCKQSDSVISDLIEKGCDPAAIMENDGARGVIHLACEDGRLEMVKLLLQKKPDLLNATDCVGQTPVIWAAGGGHDHIVKFLAEQGANLDRRSFRMKHVSNGYSALRWAVEEGHKKVVAVLIEKNAQLNQPDFTTAGRQAIHHACTKGDLDIVELLLQKKPTLINKVDRFGRTPLIWAASRGHAHIVRELIKRGVDINIHSGHTDGDTSGYSPLHWAAVKGYIEVAKDLIANNAHLDQVDHRGAQAIHLACREGHLAIVKLLLEKQPDLLNQADREGQTPVLLAASHGHADIVSYLAEQGAYLDRCSGFMRPKRNGYSPLHWAALNGHTKVARVLIENNAQPDQIDGGGGGFQPIHLACRKGHLAIVKLLLEKDPNLLNKVDSYGQTPLLWAASRGHADIVDYLAKQGADLNLATNRLGAEDHGNTPLHWAAKKGSVKTIRVLLKNGANAQCVNSKGKTPADLSALCKSQVGLLEYCQEVNRREDSHYKTSFSFFGRQFNLGCPAKEKKEAANALKSVVFEGADKSCLDVHQKALNNGTLHSLYRRVK